MRSFCFFFFFKQKTAYEMRISDWSSDVCSSDLVDPVAQELVTAEPEVARVGDDRVEDSLRRATDRVPRRGHAHDRVHGGGALVGREAALHEIGRASGRERVCQYV